MHTYLQTLTVLVLARTNHAGQSDSVETSGTKVSPLSNKTRTLTCNCHVQLNVTTNKPAIIRLTT